MEDAHCRGPLRAAMSGAGDQATPDAVEGVGVATLEHAGAEDGDGDGGMVEVYALAGKVDALARELRVARVANADVIRLVRRMILAREDTKRRRRKHATKKTKSERDDGAARSWTRHTIGIITIISDPAHLHGPGRGKRCETAPREVEAAGAGVGDGRVRGDGGTHG